LIKRIILIVIFTLISQGTVFSQLKSKNPLVKWGSWALLQAIPSPTYFEDRNESDSRLKFGLEWQVIPFSYSFNTNKYVSPVNFFFMKPSKRFSGSAEVFFEPSLVTGSFKYADLQKFMYKTGARIVLPVAQRGEYMAISFGAGYYSQKTNAGDIKGGVTYEAAVYSLFGMLGLKFNYNQNAPSRFNFGLYLKYY
jgi:hypothetical protein